MEWSSRTTTFSATDRENFGFHKDHKSFEVLTINISKPQDGDLKFEPPKTLRSENEYRDWIESCRPSSETQPPTLILAMHRRLEGNGMGPTDLPYGKAMFKNVCQGLFQHRSVNHALPRKSTAIIDSRPVDWGPGSPRQSIVFNCISDTESGLHGNGDIILSTTCFTAIPLTYGVFYGCNEATLKRITTWLRQRVESCFHPMMLPMVFVELERKRLLDAAADQGTSLRQSVLEMENRSRNQDEKNAERAKSNSAGSAGDSEIIKMLLSMNALKNGLAGFLTQLSSMRDHLGKPSEITLAQASAGESLSDADGVNIDSRLKEVMAEFESKLRIYQGLLETITLATQMEATDFTRTDSWVNFTIARSSKRDSTHMKFISLMGMLFLPGTFLATLFSTDFFNWMPSTNSQVVSPWVALYFGLAAIATGFTLLYWHRRITHEEPEFKQNFFDDLESARQLMDEASRKRPNSMLGEDSQKPSNSFEVELIERGG
ncbi:unnamed protein product [Discula destructiva]